MAKKPDPAPDPESCASCKYHLGNKEDEYGFCRRYPPSVQEDEDGTSVLWSITSLSEWCGEFSRKLHS